MAISTSSSFLSFARKQSFLYFWSMAKDIIHEAVKTALIADGWIITHDPYTIKDGDYLKYYIDLGAERLIVAEKENERIAVEVKSFIRDSLISDFHLAVGQFMNYKIALQQKEPERVLYLAMPDIAHERIEKLNLLQKSIEAYNIKLILVNLESKTIAAWKE